MDGKTLSFRLYIDPSQAECGAGKTLIALGSELVHGAGGPISGLVMAPLHLVEKWARETNSPS
jgi:hypothetical protein